jgi:eukaryotic-like serine/threonine-protein kinase
VSEPARVLHGRYALLRELGRGAMGVVWLARDELLRREVAVKQLLVPAGLGQAAAEQAASRAMREARIAARLHHPNAISVFDVVTADGQPWLVMEYLPSRSLAEALTSGPDRTLPPAIVAAIGARVAAALAAAHELGIVHRDVKPGNVLLGDGGAVKITDFGIARASDDVAVTQTGMMAGTPAYLSPEVARGFEPGPASDVFSLGATLYAAVEGQPPFGLGENDIALLHRVASGQYRPPASAGPLTEVLHRLLATDPRARPTAAAAAELLGAVERAGPADAATTVALGPAPVPPAPQRTVPGPPRSGTLLQPAPERRPRWVWPAAAAALLVAAAVAVLVAVLNLGNEPGAASSVSTTTAPPPATSQEQTTTTVESTEPTTAETTTEEPQGFDQDDVADFVENHYSALPEDTETAWNNLTTRLRPPYEDYVAFWSGYQEVDVESKPDVTGEGAAFSVEIELSLEPLDSDEATVERHRLQVVVEDDRLLIDQLELIEN